MESINKFSSIVKIFGVFVAFALVLTLYAPGTYAADITTGDDLGGFFGDGVGSLFGDSASYYYGDGGGSLYGDGGDYYYGDGAGSIFGDSSSYYYGDGSGAYYGDGSGNLYGDSSGYYYGDGAGSLYGDGSGYYYGDGSGSIFGDGSNPYFGDGSGYYYGDGLNPYFGDGLGTYFGDGAGGLFGDGLGTYFGDGAGSLFGDGSGYLYGDGAGALFGDGSGALFGDSSPYEVYGLYSQHGIYDTYVDEFGVRYSYSDSFAQQSCSYCSTPRTSSASAAPRPSFASAPPIVVSNPSYPAPRPPSYPPQQPPRPQPQPPVTYPPQPSSNLTTNTCVGNSCNTNVNNIDNSINGSFNSTQLAPATPQYLVQYTYPPVVPPAPIYPQQGLYCVITASPGNIQNGQAAILSWTSYGATSAWLSDGIGVVAPNGTLAVRPNISTTYTLTISGYGGTRSCTTYVNVSGAPYVSLSQIPYTGFDLGTFGNTIYWIGLLAFALSGAYLVLYYKGGAAVFAGSMISRQAGPTQTAQRFVKVRAEKAPVMFSQSAAPRAFTPTTHVPESLPVARTGISPKDSMTFASSSNGDAPRIVVSRS